MKKLVSILAMLLLVTTGCSNQSPDNLGEVQGLEPIETTVVEADAGEYASKYDASQYSIDNPFIAINPYDFNELSAYVVFPIEGKATYSYTVVGKDEYSNYTQTSTVEQSDNLIIPIIGLYQDYNNTIEITVDYKNGGYEQFAINIQTPAIEDQSLAKIDVDTSYSDQQTVTDALEGGFMFLASGDAYDANGDLRVKMSSNGASIANPFHVNEDGSLLIFKHGLKEIDLTGRVITEYTSPEGYDPHHDAISASNGYVYSLMTPNNSYEEFEETGIYNEGIISVWKRGEGDEPVLTVDFSPQFEGNKVNNAPTNQDKGTDLLHFNSLSYYEPTNTLLVSSQSENFIMGVDADTLEVLWTTADEEVGDAYEDLKLEWKDGHVHSNGQHNIQVTSNPKYDDGNDKTIEMILFSNYYVVDENNKSVYAELGPDLNYEGRVETTKSDVLVYRVDTENNTVETIDQFGYEGYASETMSGYTESPDYKYGYVNYANQNRMLILDADHNILGEMAIPVEIDPTQKVYTTSYRMPVINAEQLNAMADTGLESTNY